MTVRHDVKICCCRGGEKQKGAGDTSEPTMMHEVQREKHLKKQEERQASERLSSACGTACAEIICNSDDPRRFSLTWRVGKCITRTSSANESKIAAIGAPVRNDGRVNLWDIWQSNNVLRWIRCSFWPVMTAGYMRVICKVTFFNYLFIFFTTKIAVWALHNVRMKKRKRGT